MEIFDDHLTKDEKDRLNIFINCTCLLFLRQAEIVAVIKLQIIIVPNIVESLSKCHAEWKIFTYNKAHHQKSVKPALTKCSKLEVSNSIRTHAIRCVAYFDS